MTAREIHWKFGNADLEIRLEQTGDRGVLHFGDRAVSFSLFQQAPSGGWLESEGRNRRFYVHHHRDQIIVWLDGRTYSLTRVQKGQTAGQTAASASNEVRALMPGKILRIDVAAGDAVTERQTVVTMESMKMETSLAAPRAGRVSAVKCQVGQAVDMGEILVIIE